MLSRTYNDVFCFIRQYQKENQQSPSFTEIAAGCQISVRTARKYVETLQTLGYLSHEIGKVRAIRILKSEW